MTKSEERRKMMEHVKKIGVYRTDFSSNQS
jgi:hypothetical protein